MSAAPLSLDDKYTCASGRIFLTGTQALVRLPLLQRSRDLAAGLNTGGFISGSRGSPLGGFDQALWKARVHLDAHHVFFTPGVNEELAATAVWGSQQAGLFPGAKYDGVFAMWYGKGPGVDRCGDVFKHANAAGTAKHGGVLRPGVYNLEMTARVKGVEMSRGNFKDMYWSLGEIIARASDSVMLQPGDVIGSGTVGTGCLLD